MKNSCLHIEGNEFEDLEPVLAKPHAASDMVQDTDRNTAVGASANTLPDVKCIGTSQHRIQVNIYERCASVGATMGGELPSLNR